MNGKRKRYLKSLRTKKIPKTKPQKYKRLNLPKANLADFIEGKKPPIVTKKSFKEIYQTFLKTDYWKKVRKLVLERDKNTCQGCGSKRWLQVHHLTYKHHKVCPTCLHFVKLVTKTSIKKSSFLLLIKICTPCRTRTYKILFLKQACLTVAPTGHSVLYWTRTNINIFTVCSLNH